MILPFQPPDDSPDAAPLTGAEILALENFLHGGLDRIQRPALAAQCVRDGHLPTARWREGVIRCFRCTRCGQETQP